MDGEGVASSGGGAAGAAPAEAPPPATGDSVQAPFTLPPVLPPVAQPQVPTTLPPVIPPVRAPPRAFAPPTRGASSRHASAIAQSRAQQALPRVILGPVTGMGLGLKTRESIPDGEVALEEMPLLQESDCDWSDMAQESKVARIVTSFGANSDQSPCDGDLMVKCVKALVSMSEEAKRKLLALGGPDHWPAWPPEHPLLPTLKNAAGIAGKSLQIPGMWPVEELEEGLRIIAFNASQDELVYEVACRANHSCSPNALAEISPDGKLRVRALRSIPAGAEVTLSYAHGLGLLHWQARQRLLWDTRGFTCSCQRCKDERSVEETARRIGSLTLQPEPDAEPDGEKASYASSEPEAEAASVPRSPTARGSSIAALPQSHLRCVKCLPMDGPSGRVLDQATYVQWLSDATLLPTLQRVGKLPVERRAVVGSTWQCARCGLHVDLRGDSLDATAKQVHELAQVEMQLTHQALEHFSAKDLTKLLELWPMCERVLGPWHGVTLFCALQALPLLREERAYKVRARLALAGWDDRLNQRGARP